MSDFQDEKQDWIVFDPVSLGEALSHFRRSSGLTQEELAAQSGMHRPYLSQLEQGHATTQTERLFRVLRRLGLEVAVRPRTR